MKNFIFKSNESDFHKMFQSVETIKKNTVYLTYKVDTILKLVKESVIDKDLQLQVDKYFERTPAENAALEDASNH